MHCHHCEHELKYCVQCDVVYCGKCGREWGKSFYAYPYWNYRYYVPTWTGASSPITTTGTFTSNIGSTTEHNHS